VVEELQLVKIPDSMSFNLASLLEPLGVCLHTANLIDPKFTESLGQLLIDHYNCPAKIVKQEQKKLINITNSDKKFKEIINDFGYYKTNILKRKNSIFELILEIFKG
jgi:hypothetical protein